MLRTYRNGAEIDVIVASSANMTMAGGGRTVERMANRAIEVGEFRGFEPVHDHERRTGPQPEKNVVDAGVEGQRHRHQVG